MIIEWIGKIFIDTPGVVIGLLSAFLLKPHWEKLFIKHSENEKIIYWLSSLIFIVTTVIISLFWKGLVLWWPR